MSSHRILVVDDDTEIRALVRTLLERAGATVREAGDGREALRVFFDARPDLVILDVEMPEMDGWETLERLRDLSEVPVLMLTARGAEMEKVRGLRSGADDYVTKPFGRQEFLARVNALLRRSSGAKPVERETYEDGLIAIDVADARVTVNGTQVQLTPLEFRLLVTFTRHPDQVLSRDQLLDLVWGDSAAVAADQVKLYVGYLRRKLEPALDAASMPIATVRGFGYRYSAAPIR
jgi:DNA-binding response OmpR family regulator